MTKGRCAAGSLRQPLALWPLLAAAALLTACSGAPRAPSNPAADRALAGTQRGAAAFERGDLTAAQAEYALALKTYEALADTEGRARTLLSMARIAAQAGREHEALAAVEQIIAEPPQPGTGTLVIAHGRAATLMLGTAVANTDGAERHIEQAAALCGGRCPEAGALVVLRARAALARGQAAAALKLAGDALQMPAQAGNSTAPSAERANALRVQAQAQASLGQHQASVDAAAAALEIDRALGAAARVTLDLQLLSDAYRALGATELAQQYRLLAERSRAAQSALRGERAAAP